MRLLLSVLAVMALPACSSVPVEDKEVAQCRIHLSGTSEAEIFEVTADKVVIYLDGSSRLRINSLTARETTTISDGYSRVETRE